ncbi:MAG: lipid-A-disaccharide synthase [Candidatus Omnitrophota bacterium]|nr:lipid-A-disaccharide synthase [Candidatus Omnitrophota bacterium]
MSAQKPKKIIIIAGEASGDLHGACLAKSIKALDPKTEILGIGGQLMADAGVKLYYDIVGLAVIGFIEILTNLKKFKSIYNLALEKIDNLKPDAVILIDYPGFNLKIARQIKKRRIPVFYYISPQVWAWGKNRVKTISELVDKMLVVFEFEKEFYKQHGINAAFVGHPLLDTIKPPLEKDQACRIFNLDKTKPIVGILAGSRENEIKRHLTIMLEAARMLKKDIPDIQFIISKPPQIPEDLFNYLLKSSRLSVGTITEKTYNLMNAADLVLVASGTATLEAAISLTPMIIIYKVSPLTYFLIRRLIRIPYIGLVNIVAGKKIMPEFIQYQARPKNISRKAAEFLKDRKTLEQLKGELIKIREKLGGPGASRRAAEIILSSLNKSYL